MIEYFSCGGMRFTRLWHCFGGSGVQLDLAVIRALLTASRSNVLPINTHRLDPKSGCEGLELGYGGVTLSAFDVGPRVTGMIRMLNINHRTSAEDAVETTKLAVRLTGYKVIKLEVLNSDLRTSNQRALVQAVRQIRAWNSDLLVFPLLANDLRAAEEFVDLGCPLLRVMGSPIGSRQGVLDERTLERICDLGLPVILDGGVGCIEHVRRTWPLGLTGILINSMLFGSSRSPVEVMLAFATEFEQLIRLRRPSAAAAIPVAEGN